MPRMRTRTLPQAMALSQREMVGIRLIHKAQLIHRVIQHQRVMVQQHRMIPRLLLKRKFKGKS